MEKNIIKQAKADIFKELYPIINFYIRKGAKPNALKKYYKNNKRFNDLLEDIKNKGINLVKDEADYKKLVKEILNEILDDFISKLKDDEYKNKQDSKMKHIKEFVETEKSEHSELTTDFKTWDELFGKLAWKYKPTKSGEMWLDGEETYKELSKDFHLKKNEEFSWLLSIGAGISFVLFMKGLIKDILYRNADKIMSRLEKGELLILSKNVGKFLDNGGKIKFSEDYVYYTFELDELTIKINKQKKYLTYTYSDDNGTTSTPISLTENEIKELVNSLKEEENNQEL